MDKKQYSNIPKFYDQLMNNIPYKFWLYYIKEILKLIDYNPQNLLDVACGTGTMTKEFKDAGLEVFGIDLSEGMIEHAKKKYPDIDFKVCNASDFDLYKTFDLAISLFDSLNYITEKLDLQNAFISINKHLNPNGYLIFDVNTIYALSNNFFQQTNLETDNYPHYVWKPYWDKSTRICTVNMTFECKDENGDIMSFKETHLQKGYQISELAYMLEKAGFEVIHIFNAYKFTKPTKRSDRVYYVAKKI